ncbi:LOW QUALITY PROTEIN: uncharacterized protein LOC112555880 [Pomacea canaliculata]|uniref:LOW QUALITY PROTEIN: uncharacterized protein LOC112555880 n=1 Tax=Pomacea canaliculata TaxID=400727 RepID=UPI000D73DB42|nr:LOW QUALITY PROTEIN: uncharacterized protein LOC112555880 [Pomacea canaliculata]
MSFTEENRKDLEEKGYTVVKNVLTEEECQTYINQYKEWLADNFPSSTFPHVAHSLVQRYQVGHLEPSWRVRLRARDIFAQIWETKRLLSSVDAVAIGRPPEDGEEDFHSENRGWLHVDQSPNRSGLHAFQGAVYLEHADEDDWTFEVIEGSHRYFDEYYEKTNDPRRVGARGHRTLRDEYFDWLTENKCCRKRVPVPRGGMVLWDSRLVHANARPVKGRKNPGRWRWVVIVCMAPASWATKESLKIKRDAYNKLLMTTHWPCDDVGVFPVTLPSYAVKELHPMTELPEVARGDDAKRLMGICLILLLSRWKTLKTKSGSWPSGRSGILAAYLPKLRNQ